jgi:SP family galactose:H+ symporter-like MFS transporter
MKEAVFGP